MLEILLGLFTFTQHLIVQILTDLSLNVSDLVKYFTAQSQKFSFWQFIVCLRFSQMFGNLTINLRKNLESLCALLRKHLFFQRCDFRFDEFSTFKSIFLCLVINFSFERLYAIVHV